MSNKWGSHQIVSFFYFTLYIWAQMFYNLSEGDNNV